MVELKKLGVFVALLVLLGAGAALLFWEVGGECLTTLGSGTAQADYLMAASDTEGGIYALGRTDKGYTLVVGDQAGNRTDRWTLTADTLPERSTPALLYPAAGGAVYLGLYNTEEARAHLQLYRVTDQGRTAELLLDQPCNGGSLPEQMDSVRLSAFSQVDNVVTFAVIQGDNASFYQRTSADSGLEQLDQVKQSGLHTALALSDGILVLATDDSLIRTDRDAIPLTGGENIIQLTQAGTGVYYVDGASLTVFYADFADWQPYALQSLEKEEYDLDDCTNLWVTRDGDVLLLMEGNTLLLDRGTTVSDISGMLCRPTGQCVLIFGGIALGVLVLTVLLWFVVCEQRRFRLPLLVRWGVLTAAVAVLGTAVLVRGVVIPVSQRAAQREANGLMGVLTAQVCQEYPLSEDGLPKLLADSLADTPNGLCRDTAAALYERSGDGVWTLAADNAGGHTGSRGEVNASFDRVWAERANTDGSAMWSYTLGGQTHYVLYRMEGERLLAVDLNGQPLLEASWQNCSWMVEGLSALAILLTAVVLAILCWITIGLRRSLRGMERLAAGEREVLVVQGGGDELTSLAEDVNALSGALQDVDRQQSELAQSYRRFVPERVLSLLGKTSILEVDKQTFASRNLAAMMLSFHFPAQVYEKSGRELFDNVNEIIERTASIVTQKGGAVFNFTYDGYDSVFEGGSAVAVSTAVAIQQEVLDINRERELSGQPPVVVRIALDEGNVMMGVVGDENQIQPTSISSSFSIVKHLLELCGRLEANILCTESVIDHASGYGSRYMGKCMEGGQPIRTYEIFDGDAYEIRKVKETTGSRFSQGVYALYSREFSQAKRIFLNLVHNNTGDGGARYYLYLADRMEKQPEEEISLDSGL